MCTEFLIAEDRVAHRSSSAIRWTGGHSAWKPAVAGLYLLSLSACRPQTPPPKSGYHTTPPVYNAINPGAIRLALGEIPLHEGENHSLDLGACGTVRRSQPAVVAGTIIHPDERFQASAVIVRLFHRKGDGSRELINETGATATGKGGRLDFEAEMRIPKEYHGECDLEVKVNTWEPGLNPGEDPVNWELIPCIGRVKIVP
jgi:hypothetical protein